MLLLRFWLIAVCLAATLYPQGVLERSYVSLPEDERKAIEDARRGAKPRPVTSRKTPLGKQEKERVRAFEVAMHSVVQIMATGTDSAASLSSLAQSLGTGVVWDSSGHIVTNYHVIAPDGTAAETMNLMVFARDGAEHKAELVGTAPEHDLALIRVESEIRGTVPIRLGNSSELVVGQAVMALGNPLGYEYSLTTGIVSALDRNIPSPANTPIRGVIQTDAAINMGNSGGPLLNSQGLMVGMNAAMLSPSGWSAGLGYAIPSDTVIAEIGKLMEKTRVGETSVAMSLKEQAAATVFIQAKHSVVGVHTRARYLDFWTGDEMYEPLGGGSGVIWDTEGHVVTNFHVVATRDRQSGAFRVADLITVSTDYGSIVASVVATRPDIDIAVLKLDYAPEGLRPIPIGSTSGLSIGQSVLALGNPFGSSHSLTGGIISALNRALDSPSGKTIKGALQTDAAINPGNSGGPLLDMNGRLLGINAMIMSSTGVNANVGFAIPVELIRREIKDIAGEGTTLELPQSEPNREDSIRAAVFKKARASVVFVTAETRKYDVHDNWTGNIYKLPPASGTGLVWDNKGHIVTSYTTVIVTDPMTGQQSEADRLTVTLANGETYRARIIGRSLEHRIAVLRVFAPFKDLRPLPLLRTAEIKIGQDLVAIGNPFGLDYSLSAGTLSAGRDLNARLRGVIQTDAAINPGNVGGPILDSDGNLVGMGFFIEGPGAHSGINFALSVTTLNRIVPLLLTKGQVERPSLGFVSIEHPPARKYFKTAKGVIVESVDTGSPAEKAGLRGIQPSTADIGGYDVGDVIIGLRGRPVDNSDALWDLIEQEPPGTPLPLDVLRDGKRIKLVIYP